MITRHYISVGNRRVHYRRCGNGPPLLMVHQSPRSSSEYEPLMRQWGAHFTCVAPDTPGFGQSDPLSGAPEIDDFADACVALLDALGLDRVHAYGFHSGGIILVTALKRHPQRFNRLAVGGYAIWTPQEMAIFGEAYLPPFNPSAYGEHLTWLWNRVLEQSWFFPWFDVRPEARLSVAHDDPARVHAVVMDMLNAGDAYRAGYGAVLRAPRDIPPADAVAPPVLITAYDGDPLQAHIDRLGAMPKGWEARKVGTAAEHQAASLAFLMAHAGAPVIELAQADDCGFIAIKTGDFDGLIHWRGNRHDAHMLVVHAPGREMEAAPPPSWVVIDMPGHGLSDDWVEPAPTEIAPWLAVTEAAREVLCAGQLMYRLLPEGDPARLFPDLTPDRFGHYLTKAWSIVRAGHFFNPWYEANAAHASAFEDGCIGLDRMARDHRALLRARAAREMMIAYSTNDY
jgi:haloalkane dehalogenase